MLNQPITVLEKNSENQRGLGTYLPFYNQVNYPLRYPVGPHFRYHLPVSFADILRLKHGHPLPSYPEILPTQQYPIPPEWQILSQYLYANGVLKQPNITFDKVLHGEPSLFAVRLWAANSPTDGSPEVASGGYSRGISGDIQEALSKVFGELLERYPLSIYREKDLCRASISDLERGKRHFLDPFLASHASTWQKKRFPRRFFTRDSIFNFVEGYSLTKRRDALIPAQLVFFNYRATEGEPVLRESNTNGAGGMFTRDEAILSGLYELIQRDAFLLYWLTKRIPKKISVESFTDPRITHHLKECREAGLEVHFMQLDSAVGIPVYIAAVLDRTGRGAAVSLGGGCGGDDEDSLLRALVEALSVRIWQNVNEPSDELPSLNSIEPFTLEWGAFNRQLLWAKPELLDRFSFFIAATPVPFLRKDKTIRSPRERLDELLELFKARGPAYEVFLFEASHPILRKLNYHSVKICVPGLISLYMNETFAPLGSSRLYPFGYKDSSDFEVNVTPHPFP